MSTPSSPTFLMIDIMDDEISRRPEAVDAGAAKLEEYDLTTHRKQDSESPVLLLEKIKLFKAAVKDVASIILGVSGKVLCCIRLAIC
jgi:hypothetical protein